MATNCCRCRCGCVLTAAAACSRHRQVWRHGFLLLVVAGVLSLAMPRAPLSHLLLSKDNERRRLLAENELRFHRSQRYLQQYRASQPVVIGNGSLLRPAAKRGFPVFPHRPARNGPLTSKTGHDSPVVAEVGVTVITMARGRLLKNEASFNAVSRTHYLTQSVARLLELLNDTQLTRSYTLRICNVDNRPELFPESQDLEDIVPTFTRYGGEASLDWVRLEPLQLPTTIWEKLKLDYVYCLQQTMAQEGVRYGLIVEDDGFAHEDLFRVLEHVLDRVVEAPGTRPVTSVKLYHPPRLLGYISLEMERLPELFSLAVVVGAALTALLPCRQCTSFLSHHQDVCHNDHQEQRQIQVMRRWAGWSIVVAVLALAMGRTNLIELRRLSPHLYQVTHTPSCCTQALLYTQHGAADVSRHLLNVTCTEAFSTDTRMDEFRQETGARCLLVQPNLFTHIGMISTLRSDEVSPFTVD